MTKAHFVGVYGTRYFATEPLYLTEESGRLVFDRVKRRWLDWDELQAKATAESHTWQTREVGIPSILWQLGNSLAIGQRWAPGLDDTEALATEAVVNGELFTGAPTGSTGATPPTSWNAAAGTTFQLFGGEVLNIYPDPVLGGSMDQDLTLTPGTHYVCEILLMTDTVGGSVTLSDSLNSYTLPLKGVNDGDDSEVNSFSFLATEATMNLAFTVAPGDLISVDHIRVFEESELTGSG